MCGGSTLMHADTLRSGCRGHAAKYRYGICRWGTGSYAERRRCQGSKLAEPGHANRLSKCLLNYVMGKVPGVKPTLSLSLTLSLSDESGSIKRD